MFVRDVSNSSLAYVLFEFVSRGSFPLYQYVLLFCVDGGGHQGTEQMSCLRKYQAHSLYLSLSLSLSFPSGFGFGFLVWFATCHLTPVQLLSTSGMERCQVPVTSNFVQQALGWMVGKQPEFIDPKFVAQGSCTPFAPPPVLCLVSASAAAPAALPRA